VAVRGAWGGNWSRAGLLDTEDDVFYLSFEEVHGVVPRATRRELVSTRRALRIAYEKFRPPPTTGPGRPEPIVVVVDTDARGGFGHRDGGPHTVWWEGAGPGAPHR